MAPFSGAGSPMVRTRSRSRRSRRDQRPEVSSYRSTPAIRCWWSRVFAQDGFRHRQTLDQGNARAASDVFQLGNRRARGSTRCERPFRRQALHVARADIDTGRPTRKGAPCPDSYLFTPLISRQLCSDRDAQPVALYRPDPCMFFHRLWGNTPTATVIVVKNPSIAKR